METGIFICYGVMNVCLFIAMVRDKRKAVKEQWRIKEKTLWFFAIFGGALGGWLAMKVVRHKTKHPLFAIGFPFLAILQLIMIYIFIW